MTRKEARNQAFMLIFEKSINGYEVEDILESAKECRDFLEDEDGYTVKVFTETFNNIEEIDAIISENLSSGWTISRISKVALAVLRLAIYEIKYVEDVPDKVAINEAVELAKKFDMPDSSSFVNGVLAGVVNK